MKRFILLSSVFFLALTLTFGQDTYAHHRNRGAKHKHAVVVKPVPPTVIVARPAIVRSGYVWVDGHYKWNRRTRSYVWVRAHYVKHKRGKVWVSGRWRRVHGGWAYQPAGWYSVSRF